MTFTPWASPGSMWVSIGSAGLPAFIMMGMLGP